MSLKSFIWDFLCVDVFVLHLTFIADSVLSDIITEQQSKTVLTVKEDNQSVQDLRNEP